MSEQRRPRRAGRQDPTPQRVEQAAEAMKYTASSGYTRGYVPPQSTGPVQGMGHPYSQNTGGYNPDNPRMNTGAYPPNYAQQAFYQQQTGQGMAMGQRGFSMASSGGNGGSKPPKKKKTGWLVFAAVVLLAVLAAGGVTAAQSYQRTKQITDKVEPYNSLYVPGVYVDGISLGGMTPEQAMNSVQSQIRQQHDSWQVELVYQGQTAAVINADMLGMTVDAADVMNQAWLQGHSGDYEARYEQMLRLESEPYQAYTAKPSGNTAVINQILEEIKSRIDMPASDAQLLAFDTTQTNPFIYSEEVFGRRLDIEPILTRLYQMVSTMESGKVELVPETVEPSVRKADLEKHYALRASAVTPISTSSSENRNNNIRRAFQLINGYILQPGKTFSFNNVVGERTLANGFSTAIEYAYGEHVMGVGGGVCQASTTVYQAAVCAGMQIVKREPHSDAVSYTDYGKDATVSWVGKRKVDFSFKNTTDEPIYITAAVQTDPTNKKRLVARVNIYGQYMGDTRYELESEITEVIPAPFEPEYVKDKDGEYVTYTDQQKSVSKAQEGYIVKSYRVQYTGNVATERKDLYTDTYKPKPERIYVGVKNRD